MKSLTKLFNNRFENNKFARDTFIVTFGVFIAQIIPILAYPILSRIYTPTQFGILATLVSISGLMSTVATLKYENSLLIVKGKKLAAEFSVIIISISFIIITGIGILLYLFRKDIATILKEPEIEIWLWVCPISSFCIVLFNWYNEWCTRNAYFKSLAINKIINGSTIPLGKLSLGFGLCNAFGLIIGDLLGHIITGISCISRAIKKDKELFTIPRPSHIKYLLKRYSNLPLFYLPGQFLNKIGGELPVFFSMAFFSSTELGYYSMATMVLALPTNMISKAIYSTFRKHANDKYYSQGSCFDFYIKIIKRMGILSIIIFSILAMISPKLFVLILGEKWLNAGVYCQYLCPMIAINFVSEIGSAMYIITEKMNLLLLWQVLYLLGTLIALLIGVYFFKTIEATLTCLCIARSLVYLTDIFFTSRLSKYGQLTITK